jgi:hypothetical protein
MKIVELLNNLTVPLNNEEAELLTRFDESEVVARKDFSPREQLIANQLVVKEVLTRKQNGSQIIYKKKIRSV